MLSAHRSVTEETVVPAQIMKLRIRQKTGVRERVLISCSMQALAKSVLDYHHPVSDPSQPSKADRIPCRYTALRTVHSFFVSSHVRASSPCIIRAVFDSHLWKNRKQFRSRMFNEICIHNLLTRQWRHIKIFLHTIQWIFFEFSMYFMVFSDICLKKLIATH